MLSFTFATVWAQNIQVKGTVVSGTDNEPLPGVNVVLKGNTGTGTITDIDGVFSLSVPSDAVLTVSYIGFVTQDVPVNGQSLLKVVLKEDNETLDEVVVIGYGVQKKSVVTASIASVSSEDLGFTSPVRVDNALKGLAAGVQVSTQNGQPGSAAKIRIRGTGTINNSDPLYIVDGMPIGGGIDNINPADIASIEVLKDAASAAVYGARAANGVVLVTTKKGSIGKARVTYDFSYGWQSPWRQRKMLNASQYATLMNEAADYAGQDPMFANTNLGAGTNWQDALFNDGAPVQNHQLSVSGATEKVNYYFSAGYYNQEGIIGGNYDKSNYERLSFRSNTMYTLFDETKNRNWLRKLTFGLNVSYSRINSIGVTAGSLTGSPLGDALLMDPTMPVYVESEDQLQSWDHDVYGEPIRDPKTGKLFSMPSPDFNELVDRVRTRAGLATKPLTIDNLIDERRVEFVGEGKRYFDLVRTDKAATVLTEGGGVILQSGGALNETSGLQNTDDMVWGGQAIDDRPNWTANKKYLPIPQSEIEAAQGTITQNEYW